MTRKSNPPSITSDSRGGGSEGGVAEQEMDSVEQLKADIQRAEVAAEALKLTSRTGVELDRKRQGNRECLRALRKQDIAARERQPGDLRPPARSFQFRPGGVVVRMTRAESIAALERDQARLEADIDANAVAKKKALKDLNDAGGVPDSVGQGLLNAFVNLRDDTGAKGSGAPNSAGVVEKRNAAREEERGSDDE